MVLGQRPLSTIYDNLSLTNSTLFNAYNILWRIKNLFPIDDYHFLSHRRNHNPLLLLCPLCPTWPPAHLLHLIYIPLNSFTATLRYPALKRLLTFHVPSFIPLCMLRDDSLETPPPQKSECRSILPFTFGLFYLQRNHLTCECLWTLVLPGRGC